MIAALFDDLKLKVDGMLKLAVAGAIVAGATTAALICFAVVLFLWTQQNYGTLEGWVALGALFVLVAAIGTTVFLVVRQRVKRRQPRERAQEASALARFLQEPAVLLTGVQIARTLGARGLLPLLILGAVVGGVMMNRNGHSGHEPRRGAETGTAESAV
ncbi:MAG: hypothetical protein WD207_05390 [Xanthobacteraceae bacterium]